MFIIPSKFNEKMFPILEETLEAIYKYRTNDKIVIVDSFSSNDSYLLEIEKKPNVFIFDEKNKDYPPGAFAKVLLKNPDEKFYCLIHDNTLLKSDLANFIDNTHQFYSFFNGGINNDISTIYGTSSIGIDNYDVISYANEMFKDTKYVPMRMGSAVPYHHFVIKNDLAKSLIDSKLLHNVKVEHKTQDNAWERIFGMIFEQEGYCAGQYYIDENYGPSNNSILFEKKSYNRN
jgi:hypothetical protein